MFQVASALNIVIVVGSLAGVICTIGLLLAGLGFFWQSFAGGRSNADIEEEKRKDRVDQTLKDLVDAQEKRYVQLETDHKENIKLLGQLQGKMEEQTKQQQWFEGIFINALEKFFQDNPTLAIELNSKIKQAPKKK